MKTNKLAIKQLDKQLKEWRQAKYWFHPKNGWIKVIRKTLGMTTKQLAKRLGVDRSRVIRIESDESKEALTMKSLIAVANALNCDFVYAFVPKEPLQKIIEQQAYKIAKQQIEGVSHNMMLENQKLLPKQNQEQIEALKAGLLERSLKNLWNEQ